PRGASTGRLDRGGKKTAAAIHQEVGREINQLLGRIFAQRHKDGRTDLEAIETAVRSTVHQAGAIESAEEFGRRLYGEAWKRGWSRALLQVGMGDGAEWIWNLATLHFPGALHIVDLYHARQHLWELARQLYPHDPAKLKAWIKVHQKRLLDKGKIEKLVGVLRTLPSRHPAIAEKIRTEADYFERNAERMRYPKFRRQHLFVGSGVIEAGCKTV